MQGGLRHAAVRSLSLRRSRGERDAGCVSPSNPALHPGEPGGGEDVVGSSVVQNPCVPRRKAREAGNTVAPLFRDFFRFALASRRRVVRE
jgi:hypothetical protein